MVASEGSHSIQDNEAAGVPLDRHPLSNEYTAGHRLIRWWRSITLQRRWKSRIDDLRINGNRRQQAEAVRRLQRWLRRTLNRRQLYRVVDGAEVRRKLRALVRDQRLIEAKTRAGPTGMADRLSCDRRSLASVAVDGCRVRVEQAPQTRASDMTLSESDQMQEGSCSVTAAAAACRVGEQSGLLDSSQTESKVYARARGGIFEERPPKQPSSAIGTRSYEDSLREAAQDCEDTSMFGPSELTRIAIDLSRNARVPSSASRFGFCEFGLFLSCSELRELHMEAASLSGLHVHELSMGSELSGQSSTSRNILVFDAPPEACRPVRVLEHQLESVSGRRSAMLRQEMRGLIIDRESRAVLSRPLHHFWALGEWPEMAPVEESALLHADRPLLLLEPLQGEVVHLWELDGRLHAATRAGRSPVALDVEAFLEGHRIDYAGFAHCSIGAGLTPVFVWQECSAVASHPGSVSRPELILIALRHISSGLYAPRSDLKHAARHFRIPVIAQLSTWSPTPNTSLTVATAELRELATRSLEAGRRRALPAAPEAVRIADGVVIIHDEVSGFFAKLDLLHSGAKVAPCTASGSFDAQQRRCDATKSLLLPVVTRMFNARSVDKPFPGEPVLISLHLQCTFADLQRVGGGVMCAALADEMAVSTERLELRAARLVRSRVPAHKPPINGACEPYDGACIEVTFEVAADETPSTGSGDSAVVPAAVAAATLLGSSRQRLSRLIGLPVLQLPDVHMEGTSRKSSTAASEHGAVPKAHLQESRPVHFPVAALESGELVKALEIVHEFARTRMGLPVPLTPPALAEVLASAAGQAQLLRLLQATLLAAESMPCEVSWALERSHLVSATSRLILVLQRVRVEPPLGGATKADSLDLEVAVCISSLLDALTHIGRSVDDIVDRTARAISAATVAARQTAWIDAARPEQWRVRTFVRLRPRTSFEVRPRRSRRIAWGGNHADIRPISTSPQPISKGIAPQTIRVELSEVFEVNACQQRVYSRVLEPLVGGILDGLDCALLCIGAAGTGKTYTLYGTEAARSDPLGAPRTEWGMAMRAFEACLQGGTATSCVPSPAPCTASTAQAQAQDVQVHASFIEIYGDECFDLLRSGAAVLVSDDEERGIAHLKGAAQRCIRSLEEAANMLRVAFRATSRGTLDSQTHTILTLTVSASGSSLANVAQQPPARPARLVLVDIASGDTLGRQMCASATPKSPRSVSRSLAVLGACVAARAEGATQGVPWSEATLACLLRELFVGDFCTVVLGGCGDADEEVFGTLATLQFVMNAGRVVNRIRLRKLPQDLLLRCLWKLDQHRKRDQLKWLTQRPRTVTRPPSANESTPHRGTAPVGSRTTRCVPEGPAQLVQVKLSDAIASQLGLTLQMRHEQAAEMRKSELALAEMAGLHLFGPLKTEAPELRQLHALDEWIEHGQDVLQRLRLSLAMQQQQQQHQQ
jgi:hypothetical protein